MKNGTLTWDGSADLSWEARDGTIQKALPGETPEQSLIRYMGGKDAVLGKMSDEDKAALAGKSDAELGKILMEKQGAKWNDQTKTFEVPQGVSFDHGDNLQRYVNSWNSWDANKDKGVMKAGFLTKEDVTGFDKYDNLYDAYMKDPRVKAAGSASPADYLVNNIVETSMFGSKFYTNKSMVDGLKAVETALGSKPSGFSVDGSFFPRAVNNPNNPFALSEHALGEAIDINPDANKQVLFSKNGQPTPMYNLLTYLSGKDLSKVTSFDDLTTINNLYKDAIKDPAGTLAKLKANVESMTRSLTMPSGTTDQKALAAYTAQVQKSMAAINQMKSLIKLDVKGLSNLPTQLFNVSQTFVNNMETSKLHWGVWSNQWDFMHFSRNNK